MQVVNAAHLVVNVAVAADSVMAAVMEVMVAVQAHHQADLTQVQAHAQVVYATVA
jgi:hypothetical protein